MVKFRKHDVQAARDEQEIMTDACDLKYPRSRGIRPILNPNWAAEYQILHLDSIVKNGLWDCYENFDRMMTDFYADFPWAEKEQKEAIQTMLDDQRLPAIATQIKEVHDFDIVAELRTSLALDWSKM